MAYKQRGRAVPASRTLEGPRAPPNRAAGPHTSRRSGSSDTDERWQEKLQRHPSPQGKSCSQHNRADRKEQHRRPDGRPSPPPTRRRHLARDTPPPASRHSALEGPRNCKFSSRPCYLHHPTAYTSHSCRSAEHCRAHPSPGRRSPATLPSRSTGSSQSREIPSEEH